jgi:Uma2 family endonuclease
MPDDGFRYELAAGRLLREPLPGARHGRIAARLARHLDEHAARTGLGVVLVNDTGFVLARSPDTVRGPDIAFVARERYERIGDVVTAFPGPPDLAVEVVSPSNSPADVHSKVADYLAAGTRLVWVVDPDSREVEVYGSLLEPLALRDDDELDGGEVLPGFRLRIADIFRL